MSVVTLFNFSDRSPQLGSGMRMHTDAGKSWNQA